jgi:hypothetical protein
MCLVSLFSWFRKPMCSCYVCRYYLNFMFLGNHITYHLPAVFILLLFYPEKSHIIFPWVLSKPINFSLDSLLVRIYYIFFDLSFQVLHSIF